MFLKIIIGALISIVGAITTLFVIALALITYTFDTLFKKGESDL